MVEIGGRIILLVVYQILRQRPQPNENSSLYGWTKVRAVHCVQALVMSGWFSWYAGISLPIGMRVQSSMWVGMIISARDVSRATLTSGS